MSKADVTIDDKKVKTPKFRLSYPALVKPKSFKGQAAKYSIVMLFDKDRADLKALMAAVEMAKIEKWGADKAKWPTKRLKSGKMVSAIRSPFRDGDREKPDQDSHANCIFVSASAHAFDKEGTEKPRPQCVGYAGAGARPELIDPKELYAGCFARATLIAYAYDIAGNMGVSFALTGIQKLSDGTRLGGSRDVTNDFTDDYVEEETETTEEETQEEVEESAW